MPREVFWELPGEVVFQASRPSQCFQDTFSHLHKPWSTGNLPETSVNPRITFATFLCGLCPAPRAAVYIVFQTLGAVLAGGLLRGSWGLVKAAA